MNISKKRIILSKTNRIGDVVVSLPIASLLKKVAPDCYIIMLVTKYTDMLPTYFKAVDEVVCWDDPKVQANPTEKLKSLQADIIVHLRAQKRIAKCAKMARIPLRVGSTNRLYNWLYCNKLVRVNRSRHSPYHDAQLDIQYVLPIIKQSLPTREAIGKLMAFDAIEKNATALSLIDSQKFNLILHPKCVTHAGKREWPLENFAAVIENLDPSQFNVFITGTEDDGKAVRQALCDPYPTVVDLTGKLTLAELTQFIQSADGLIAGSTGPLHIAAALGIHTLGLYTPTIGHNPSRWGPLGQRAEYLMTDKINCRDCKPKTPCACINDITPQQVVSRVHAWHKS